MRSSVTVTPDRSHLGSIADFDAVLLHYRDMVVHMELPDQRLRRPGQRYVMFFKESPQTYPYDYDRCRQHQLFLYKLIEIEH